MLPFMELSWNQTTIVKKEKINNLFYKLLVIFLIHRFNIEIESKVMWLEPFVRPKALFI